MIKVRFNAPGVFPFSEEVPEGTGILVGRRPDLASVDRTSVPVSTLRPVPVPSGLVSENHLLVWNHGGELFLRDLKSTNGSQWNLAPGELVRARSGGEVEIELAGGGEGLQKPADADPSTETDFLQSIELNVNNWLRENKVPAQACVDLPGRGDAADYEFALVGGRVLRLCAREPNRTNQTKNPRWGKAIPELWSYVHAQRGAFEVDRNLHPASELILASRGSRAVHRLIVKATQHGLRGILQGESGAGKSRFARCFHAHSERRDGPFVETNLGEDANDRRYFQLKLFGAKKGASVGIDEDRVGLVKQADGGTLFLDEVGLLPLDVQGLLLTFLDSGYFSRLGDSGRDPRQTADVQVVVGTNTDLREAVRKKTFREDLWWRLCGIVIDVPPLRERREDIEAFLQGKTFIPKVDRGSVFEALTVDARKFLLEGHSWPGNFRELDSFVRRLPMFVEGTEITRSQCEAALKAGSLEPSPAPIEPEPVAANVVTPSNMDLSDILPEAHRLLPHRLKQLKKPSGGSMPPGAANSDRIDFKVLVDDIARSLCMARLLGVEDWVELDPRPTPSYQAMARKLGFGDGASVRECLETYVALNKLRKSLPQP